MSIHKTPDEVRVADLFSHIDMGFLNRRLAISALGPLRETYLSLQKPGEDHMTVLGNDHLLVTMLIDLCTEVRCPSLAEAVRSEKSKLTFMSTERVEPCPDICENERVEHDVYFDLETENRVSLVYHTEHLVSSTGKMTLHLGHQEGYHQAMIGVLHKRKERFEIEPIVIGAPVLDHPRNFENFDSDIVWFGGEFGQILPEDIKEFSEMRDVQVENATEWMEVMSKLPEQSVKEAIASLLNEPTRQTGVVKKMITIQPTLQLELVNELLRSYSRARQTSKR